MKRTIASQASFIAGKEQTMNSSLKTSRSRLKPLALAVTLALPIGALAVSTDVVKTRADQNIDQQYGRDSVYAFSPHSRPLSPDRTSGPHWFHKTKAYNAASSERYEGYVPKGRQESVASNETQYGSGYTGGGMVGSGYTGSEGVTVATIDSSRTGSEQIPLTE